MKTPPSALVVDPDPLLLGIIRTLLYAIGFDPVLTAMQADDASDLFQATGPDIVVTALRLDPFGGDELIARIRDTVGSPDPMTPIVAMDAFTDEAAVLKARDSGANELLAKPITVKNLFDRLKEIVERPRFFVMCDTYFGPNRRHADRAYAGPDRRRGSSPEAAPEIHEIDPHADFARRMRQRLEGYP